MRVEGLVNFRDVGGLPLTAGGAVREGVLFRSDAPTTLTPAGLAQVADSPIGVVVDFRMPMERDLAPDRLPDSRAIRIVELPLLEGAMTTLAQDSMRAMREGSDPAAAAAAITAALAALPDLGELYVSMLQHGAASFASVARLVADETSAVLVHCTAGKDRTGVAVAVLLDAVGVERAAVVGDYASSAANLEGPWADRMRAMVTGMGMPLVPALDELITATPPSAIERALAWIEREHGDSVAYLRSGGLTDDEFVALRARLTA